MGKNLHTKFVGMDVHQKSISIAIADDGPDGEVRLYGTIKNTVEAIDKVIRKLVSTGAELHIVYEAGPCGFTLYRHLTGNGFSCIVAAPSMIPKKSGVRIKNDNRDAIALARLHRAGELTPIYVPDREDEAMRDLTRKHITFKEIMNFLRLSVAGSTSKLSGALHYASSYRYSTISDKLCISCLLEPVKSNNLSIDSCLLPRINGQSGAGLSHLPASSFMCFRSE